LKRGKSFGRVGGQGSQESSSLRRTGEKSKFVSQRPGKRLLQSLTYQKRPDREKTGWGTPVPVGHKGSGGKPLEPFEKRARDCKGEKI